MSEQPRLTRRELRARERAAERELRAANDAEAAAAGAAARERLAAQGRGEFASHTAEPSAVSNGPVSAAPTDTERAIAARAAVLRAAAERAAAERAAENTAAEHAAAAQRAAATGTGQNAPAPVAPPPAGQGQDRLDRQHTPVAKPVDSTFAPPQKEATIAPPNAALGRHAEETSPIDLRSVAREAERIRRREANLAQSHDQGEATAAFTPSEMAQLNAAVAAPGVSRAGESDGPKVPSRRSLRERRVERELSRESEQDPATRRRVVTSVPRSSGIRTVDSEGHITGVIPVVRAAGTEAADPTTVTALAFPVTDNQAPLPPTGALEAVTQAAAAELAGQNGKGYAPAPANGAKSELNAGASPFAPVNPQEGSITSGQANGVSSSEDQHTSWAPQAPEQATVLTQAGFGDLVSGAIDPTTDPGKYSMAGADRAFAPVALGGTPDATEPTAAQDIATPGAATSFVAPGTESTSGQAATNGAAAGGNVVGEGGQEWPTDGGVTAEALAAKDVGQPQNDTWGGAEGVTGGESPLGAGERVASPYGAGFTTQEATEQVGDMQNDLRKITGPLPVVEDAEEDEADKPKRGLLLWILLSFLVVGMVALGVYLGLRHAGVISAFGIEPTMNWNWSISGS